MRLIVVFILAVVSFVGAVRAEGKPKLFDPARHMRVSEVKPGMTGYGLTVFKGTTIERFDVEVIAIAHNIFKRRNSASASSA
jgi:hypothetical protein